MCGKIVRGARRCLDSGDRNFNKSAGLLARGSFAALKLLRSQVMQLKDLAQGSNADSTGLSYATNDHSIFSTVTTSS